MTTDPVELFEKVVPKAFNAGVNDMRNAAQAEANCAVSDLPAMPEKLVHQLRRHNWRRGVWYGGK